MTSPQKPDNEAVLLPCAFCQGTESDITVDLVSGVRCFKITCYGCYCYMISEDRVRLINNWNTRAIPPALAMDEMLQKDPHICNNSPANPLKECGQIVNSKDEEIASLKSKLAEVVKLGQELFELHWEMDSKSIVAATEAWQAATAQIREGGK